MQTFTEHYFLQEKILSDLRRAFTSNLLKKRKVGVDLGRFNFKKTVLVDKSIFNNVLNDVQRETVNLYKGKKEYSGLKDFRGNRSSLGSTLKKLSSTAIKGVYEGEIDSGAEKYLEGHPISVLVFELDNFGKIAFITTEDKDNKIRYYISTGNRGNDFLRENLGTTIEQIYASSKTNLVYRSTTFSPSKEINKITQSLDIEPESQEDDDTISINTNNKLQGQLDISKDDFINLEELWGNGLIGSTSIKGLTYKFKGKFNRERHTDPETGYEGYKYYDNNHHTVLLLDMDDGRNALIVFDGRDSYEWAKKIGMLSIWKSQSNKNEILWRKN